MDRVIQNNQPMFVIVWVGSVLSLLTAAVMSAWKLGGAERLLLILAVLVYLVGVQLPTLAINVPLNNQLQKVELVTTDGAARERARDAFEARWNRWNAVRTACASLVSVSLLLVLLRA